MVICYMEFILTVTMSCIDKNNDVVLSNIIIYFSVADLVNEKYIKS